MQGMKILKIHCDKDTCKYFIRAKNHAPYIFLTDIDSLIEEINNSIICMTCTNFKRYDNFEEM